MNTTYYVNKLDTLKQIFGTNEVKAQDAALIVGARSYPIIDDVVILLDPAHYPPSLKERFQLKGPSAHPPDYAEDIQSTFGKEWTSFPKILPEHREEFLQYFDLVNLSALSNLRVCDLGCGIGRWSYFLKDKCSELILIDFSEAIFVARENLRDVDSALFFMADLKRLPFANNFADFLFSLGVLHHLPTNAVEEVASLKEYAPALLIYLYYSLDNRPAYFRLLLNIVTAIRNVISRISNPWFRSAFTWYGALLLYRPLILLGKLLEPLRLSSYVPLYDGYKRKSTERIRQDVYDRFFTRIEQRFGKSEIIMKLGDQFKAIQISEKMPWWHFLCHREDSAFLERPDNLNGAMD